APEFNTPPGRLLKTFRPGPRSTLPIIVPEFMTASLPVKPPAGLPRIAVPARPADVVIVPKLVMVLFPPPARATPAPLPEPPVIVPPAIFTAMSPLPAVARMAVDPAPAAVILPEELTVVPVPPIALMPKPVPLTSKFPDEATLAAPPSDAAAIATPSPPIVTLLDDV